MFLLSFYIKFHTLGFKQNTTFWNIHTYNLSQQNRLTILILNFHIKLHLLSANVGLQNWYIFSAFSSLFSSSKFAKKNSNKKNLNLSKYFIFIRISNEIKLYIFATEWQEHNMNTSWYNKFTIVHFWKLYIYSNMHLYIQTSILFIIVYFYLNVHVIFHLPF